jgi:hypothetical protein
MINVWNYCFEGYASQARNGGLRWPFKRGWGPKCTPAQGLARVGSKKIEVEQRTMTAMMGTEVRAFSLGQRRVREGSL